MKLLQFLSLLLPGYVLASSEIIKVALYAKDANQLHDVVRRHPYDYGCRPIVMRSDNDEFKLHALLTEGQLSDLKRSVDPAIVRVDAAPKNVRRQEEPLAAIGQGDRFKNGSVVPRGLGTRGSESYDIETIMNVKEVDSALNALAKEYGVELHTTPYETVEGQVSTVGYVGGGCDKSNYHVYFSSAIHARERGGPDNLIYFISDLLYANRTGCGVTYGNVSYTNEQVKTALSTGIVFFPLVNPDGVRYDQATDSLWRKNRNPANATPGNNASIGIDLNRNFDFMWNASIYFDPTLDSVSSGDPTSQIYRGPEPFSEAETKNVASIYDEFPAIRWFIDIHSAAGTLLYSWGDDDNQSEDPEQNFLNPEYDGTRGIVGDDVYKEWIDAQDWVNAETAANRTTEAMMKVGGRVYEPQQAVGLYPTSGASDDWSFSRWHADKSVNKVYGYTMEFGYPTNFYPTTTEFKQTLIDVAAGLMEFCLAAAEIGLE